jgi:hypothetical protein
VKTALWVIGLAVAVGCAASEPEGGAYLMSTVELVQTDPPSIQAACLAVSPAIDPETGLAQCVVSGETSEGPLAITAADWTYQAVSLECPSTGRVRFHADAVPPANAVVRIECLVE